ncbi:hypothetical protein HYS93_01435 [Candidatus Daviesbacteria bacterium]|nr:hypothetical protein [Candidatus Daviesbacteria bacterium]
MSNTTDSLKLNEAKIQEDVEKLSGDVLKLVKKEEKIHIRILRWILFSVSGLINIAAAGIVYKTLEPVISWYLTKNPVRGIDLFLSATYTSYMIKWHDFLRPFAWKHFWFGGQPFSLDYPSLYFLGMIPFIEKFGLIQGVMHFAVFFLLIFAISCYFFYKELSFNAGLSLVLTIATILSVNLYRALVWAGGIPFWSTQAFYPLVGFLLIRFLNTYKKRWLYLASIAAGLGLLGHPQAFLNVIIPLSILILLFYSGREGLKFGQRIKNLIVFVVLWFLVGLPGVLSNFSSTLPATLFSYLGKVGSIFSNSLINRHTLESGPVEGSTAANIIKWSHDQFNYVLNDTQQLIWYLVGIFALCFVVTIIFRKHRLRSILCVLPFAIFLIYQFITIFLFSRGIDLFITGWYKAFWPIPVAAASLAAVFWGQISLAFNRFSEVKFFKITSWTTLVVANVFFIVFGYLYFTPGLTKALIARIDLLSTASSPYPDILNVKTSDAEMKEIAQKLTPKFIDPNDKNKRLYTVDATVNLWWPMLYDMPLARGYVDPPVNTLQRWGLFWLDSLMGPSGKDAKASLIIDWKTPENVAYENTKFLLDWNSVYYYLGNYASSSPSVLAEHVTTKDYVAEEEEVKSLGVIRRYGPKPEEIGKFFPDLTQTLKYYRVKPELVSPILAPNNASPILLIGDAVAYDTIYRFIGMRNLNSQKIVIATKSNFIDDYSLGELRKFDKVILYRYDYKNKSKAWGTLSKYLEKGGRIYIDTGPEGKEAASSNLPDILPIKHTIRNNIGRDWKVETADSNLTKGISFDKFSPLDFDGKPWNVSHPDSDSAVQSEAKVILKNNGKVVAASIDIGSGNLIWTGFNLPYHAIRDYNEEETKFLINMLFSGVDISEKKIGNFNYRFISPEKREVDSAGSRGVLFKEELYDSWKAKSESGKSLTLYKAGPTYPGYMYVPFSQDVKPKEVKFEFVGGIRWKIYHLISLATILILIDLILFRGFLIVRLSKKGLRLIHKKASTWWQKEDGE